MAAAAADDLRLLRATMSAWMEALRARKAAEAEREREREVQIEKERGALEAAGGVDETRRKTFSSTRLHHETRPETTPLSRIPSHAYAGRTSEVGRPSAGDSLSTAPRPTSLSQLDNATPICERRQNGRGRRLLCIPL